MKKILSSLFALVVVVAGVSMATSAYFSDTETSTDNTFVAGQIDLEVANAGYYNDAVTADWDPANPTQVGATTWTLDDLSTQLFFNFDDVKPGDWGENTTTLRAEDNPWYGCANVTLTGTGENGVNDPEGEAGDDAATGPWDGELQNELYFFAWVDDGNNVLESDETVILENYMSALPQTAGNAGLTFALADSTTNVFSGVTGQALLPNSDYYIAHGWCFGDVTYTPVPAGEGVSPLDNPGFTCSGASVDNMSQSDDVTGNISFYAVQSRNNTGFVCNTWNPNPAN